MRKIIFFFGLVWAVALPGQNMHPTSQQYYASLTAFQQHATEWRSVVSQLDPESLGASYANVKLFDLQKSVVLKYLDLTQQLCIKVQKDRRLVDQVQLMSAIQSFEEELNIYSGLVETFDMSTKQNRIRADDIAKSLSDIDGRLNDINQVAYMFTVDRAEYLEDACKAVKCSVRNQ